MANAAVASWSACIKELQQLAAGSATSPDAAQLAVDRLDKDKQSPLPSAAWKKLVRNVKATSQLAALCIKAHQQQQAAPAGQGTALQSKLLTVTVLAVWLSKATDSSLASPASRLAASVQQQLQGSGLLQHMGAILTAAADGLTAAVAAAEAFSAAPVSSSGSRRRMMLVNQPAKHAADTCQRPVHLIGNLLAVYIRACEVLSPTPDLSCPCSTCSCTADSHNLPNLQQIAAVGRQGRQPCPSGPPG